jgi:type II secretory pathway pseudopilin PulG
MINLSQKIKKVLSLIGVIITSVIAVFSVGKWSGRQKQQTIQLKQGVKGALKSKQRQAKRRNDSDATIIKRMHKYTRR